MRVCELSMRVLTQHGQEGLLRGGVIYQGPEHGKDGSRQRAGKIVPSREHRATGRRQGLGYVQGLGSVLGVNFVN